MDKVSAVFLDRDGVINNTIFRMGKPRAPYSVDELNLLPGVEEAIQQIKSAGLRTIIVSNQPDVARGWVEMDQVTAINDRIQEILGVDEIRCCFHVDADQCECRKPRPGMLLEAARKWKIDLSQAVMVGDRLSDVEAGKNAGCKTVLITGNPEGEPDGLSLHRPDYISPSLNEAVPWILSHE